MQTPLPHVNCGLLDIQSVQYIIYIRMLEKHTESASMNQMNSFYIKIMERSHQFQRK